MPALTFDETVRELRALEGLTVLARRSRPPARSAQEHVGRLVVTEGTVRSPGMGRVDVTLLDERGVVVWRVALRQETCDGARWKSTGLGERRLAVEVGGGVVVAFGFPEQEVGVVDAQLPRSAASSAVL